MSKPDYDELEKRVNELKDENIKLKALDDIIKKSPAVGIRWANEEGFPVTFITENISQWGYISEDFLSGKIGYDKIMHPDDAEVMYKEGEKNYQGRDKDG